MMQTSSLQPSRGPPYLCLCGGGCGDHMEPWALLAKKVPLAGALLQPGGSLGVGG